MTETKNVEIELQTPHVINSQDERYSKNVFGNISCDEKIISMIILKRKETMLKNINLRIEKLLQIDQIINYQIIVSKHLNIHY